MATFLESLGILPNMEQSGNPIRSMWDGLSQRPGGKALFHVMLARMVPYTGSLGARILELREGYAKVELRDRRAVRNHLRSVHAIALANLAELCGNIGVVYSLPNDARFIVKGIDIEYLKKARGTLVATSESPVPETSERRDYDVEVQIHDTAGDLVCRATLHTLVGPKKASK